MGMTEVNVFFIAFGILIGVLIGYLIATIRIRGYLKKYYPEVNFQQTRKERLEILNKQEKNK